jgi:hypothetical protein
MVRMETRMEARVRTRPKVRIEVEWVPTSYLVETKK